jgi:putative PIN family toxin of toxin-antitoxin system
MQRKKNRIVIDTNLWISFLLTKNLVILDHLFLESSITLLFSKESLDEFISVAKRPKFKKYFSAPDLQNLVGQMVNHGVFVEVISKVEVCRDPKDNFLLALSKDGKANFLITGDKDLLEIRKYDKTKIISIREFLSKE